MMAKLTDFLTKVALSVGGVAAFVGLNYLMYVLGEPRVIWFWGLVGGCFGG